MSVTLTHGVCAHSPALIRQISENTCVSYHGCVWLPIKIKLLKMHQPQGRGNEPTMALQPAWGGGNGVFKV